VLITHHWPRLTNLPQFLTIAGFQQIVNFSSVNFCRLSFPKSLRSLSSSPGQFLIFCVWWASWLRIVAASENSTPIAISAKFVVSCREALSQVAIKLPPIFV
jgi:hypothetical protein